MSFLEETILAPNPSGVGASVGSAHRILRAAAGLAGASTFRVLFPAAIVLIGIWSSNCKPVDRCGWVAANAAATPPASILKQLSPANN